MDILELAIARATSLNYIAVITAMAPGLGYNDINGRIKASTPTCRYQKVKRWLRRLKRKLGPAILSTGGDSSSRRHKNRYITPIYHVRMNKLALFEQELTTLSPCGICSMCAVESLLSSYPRNGLMGLASEAAEVSEVLLEFLDH